MTDPIDPVRPVRGDRRQTARRTTDPSPKAAAPPLAPAPLPAPAAPPPEADAKPLLEAHLLGQEGQKRGLRGGPQNLAKAKAAYLNAEWSGLTDRRTPAGVVSKTEV